MPTDPTLIHADSVTREYRLGEAVIRAVNEVSMEIRAGEFLALLGSSGSGKSTLLSMLAGPAPPSPGAIPAPGRDLPQLTSEELPPYRRESAGMVFQSFNLLP